MNIHRSQNRSGGFAPRRTLQRILYTLLIFSLVSTSCTVTSLGATSRTRTESFKTVGYFPSWRPGAADSIQYDVLTHVIYAFAIPTAKGGLLPLENPETAKKIIREAHGSGVKVLLAVGGWSYQDRPLESVFMSATSTGARRKALAGSIMKMVKKYGFDGVDIDWEHPRRDGSSWKQYQSLMLLLGKKLHRQGKLLTSAVMSGVSPDGVVYYDAAAHTDKVLKAVDWIHVMAYDGGDGERHSPYHMATDSADYWKNTRKLDKSKIVLGVPFYSRPGWAPYRELLEHNKKASSKNRITYNGMDVWYNGVSMIKKKTKYAAKNLGGIMIWEVTQDAAGPKSLQTAIKKTLNAYRS
ncbi:MAG: glycosyl hydrolase family 18 protein [Eubacteriales bacterium]|nr:glycosyl hydrolase family 18 protein [Eubacteriales bacterium]